MRKRTLFILLGAGVLVAGGITFAVLHKPQPMYETAAVRRATLTRTVTATGSVASSSDVDLQFDGSGRLRTIEKKVGDTVTSGAVLARLDDRAASSALLRAHASVLSAQASLDKLLAGASAADIRVSEVAVENAKASLLQAQNAAADARLALADAQAAAAASVDKAYADLSSDLESLYLQTATTLQTLGSEVFDANGIIRSEVVITDDITLAQQAQTAYAAAKVSASGMTANIVAFRTSVDRTVQDQLAVSLIVAAKDVRASAQLANDLLQSGDPAPGESQATYDAHKASVKAAWSGVSSAVSVTESQRSTVLSATASASSSVNAAKAKVNAADDAVKIASGAVLSAEANLALKRAPASASDIATARATLSQMQAQERDARLALEKTTLTAPFAGIVTQVSGKVGQEVGPNDVIARIHGESAYQVEADIPETDIARLSPGMDADITLDAYGDDVVFKGKVSSIDTAQTVIQDVVYYKTRLIFDAGDKAVRLGMTASITVVTSAKDGILVVPQRAVRQRDGQRYVRLLVGGAVQERTVTVGNTGDQGLIEITNGISEGDLVVIAEVKP